MKSNILNNVANYNNTLDKNICVVFLKYIAVIHEFVECIVENLYIRDEKYLKYILNKGVRCISYIFRCMLLYTKNIELVLFHSQKAVLYYVEFINQINEDTQNFLKLDSSDAVLFVYKKTIFDINEEFKQSYVETSDIKYQLSLLEQYIDIYNHTLIQTIELFDFKSNELSELKSIIFGKLYKVADILSYTPKYCKLKGLSESIALLNIKKNINEIYTYKDYEFIRSNYIVLIETMIQKHFKKNANFDTMSKKLMTPGIENILENTSPSKIINYLSSG